MIYFYISLITYFCFLFLKTRKGIKALSDNKFALKKYNKWVINKENFINLELLCIILIIIAFNANVKATEICMIIWYAVLFLNLLREKKFKLKFSKKVIGIFVLTIIIYTLILLGCYFDYMRIYSSLFLDDNTAIYYSIIILMGYFAYYIVLLSGFFVNLWNLILKKSKQ